MGLLQDDRDLCRNDHLVDEFISTYQYILYATSSWSLRVTPVYSEAWMFRWNRRAVRAISSLLIR
jgi:hypothetical protein